MEQGFPSSGGFATPVFSSNGVLEGINTSGGFLPTTSRYQPILQSGNGGNAQSQSLLSSLTKFTNIPGLKENLLPSSAGKTSATKGASSPLSSVFGGGITSSAGANAGLFAIGAYGGYDLLKKQGDSPRGDYATGIIQGTASGAAIGASVAGLPGAAIGGAIGATVGTIGAMTGSGKSKDQMKRDQWRTEQARQGFFVLNEETKSPQVQLADGTFFDMGKDGGAKTKFGTSYTEIPQNHKLAGESASFGNLFALLDGKYNSSLERKKGETGDSQQGIAAIYANAGISNANDNRKVMIENFANFLQKKKVGQEAFNSYLQKIYNDNEITKQEYEIFKKNGQELFKVLGTNKTTDIKTQGYF